MRAGLLIFSGAVCSIAAIDLPWGGGAEGSVSGLTAGLSTFAVAILIMAAASITLSVIAFRRQAVTAMGRILGVVATVIGGFLCLLVPAGIDVVAGYQEASPSGPGVAVGFGLGVWLLAAGVVAIALGTMLCCASTLRMRLALLVIPALYSLLFAIELR